MNDDFPFESPEYLSGEHFANEVMESLRESDIDPEESHPFNFYLHLLTEDDAVACAAEARLIGLEAKVVSPEDQEDEFDDVDDGEDLPDDLRETINELFPSDAKEDTEERWLCLASTDMKPSHERFTEIGSRFIELARERSGEFSGWEVNPGSVEEALNEMLGSLIERFGELAELDDDDGQEGSPEFLELDFDDLDIDDDLSPEAECYLRDACAEFNAKQNLLREEWRFAECEEWSFDQDTGVFRLDFEDGSKLFADGQILASYDAFDETWEWAWNNPDVNPNIVQDSLLARELGERHGIEFLTSGMLPAPNGPFPAFLGAVGVKASNSIGAYPADTGEVVAFLLLKNLKWVNPDDD